MKVLEILGGIVLGLLMMLTLLIGSLFAVGSIGKYYRNKRMSA